MVDGDFQQVWLSLVVSPYAIYGPSDRWQFLPVSAENSWAPRFLPKVTVEAL